MAVYCHVLQCVAVCCHVLQCVPVCCYALQCVAAYFIVFVHLAPSISEKPLPCVPCPRIVYISSDNLSNTASPFSDTLSNTTSISLLAPYQTLRLHLFRHPINYYFYTSSGTLSNTASAPLLTPYHTLYLHLFRHPITYYFYTSSDTLINTASVATP